MGMNEKFLCNVCGREIKSTRGLLQEDALFVNKDWGFFSHKDLQRHKFVICETCYDEFIESFTIPITVADKNEVLN